jgi:hypothetical protein
MKIDILKRKCQVMKYIRCFVSIILSSVCFIEWKLSRETWQNEDKQKIDNVHRLSSEADDRYFVRLENRSVFSCISRHVHFFCIHTDLRIYFRSYAMTCDALVSCYVQFILKGYLLILLSIWVSIFILFETVRIVFINTEWMLLFTN